MPKHVCVIVNSRSGGALDLPLERVVDDVVGALDSEDRHTEVDVVEPSVLTDRLKDCVSRKPDVLVVAGGDGTINAAVETLCGTDIALGILPLGTLNRLANEFAIPLDPVAAATALTAYERRDVDVAEVNGRKFLCNSIMGLPLNFSRQRQRVRGEALPDRARGYWQALQTIVRSRHRLTLTLEHDGRSETMRVLGLAISNNPYDEAPAVMPKRPALDTGRLGVYASKHRSFVGLAWVFLRAAFGRWRGDANFVRLQASAVSIAARRAHLRVSNDGEVKLIETPLNYRMHPKALCLLLPERQKSTMAAIVTGSS